MPAPNLFDFATSENSLSWAVDEPNGKKSVHAKPHQSEARKGSWSTVGGLFSPIGAFLDESFQLSPFP